MAASPRVERDLADDPAEHPFGADHGDLALGRERRLPADGEAAADDAHVRGRADRAPERASRSFRSSATWTARLRASRSARLDAIAS